MRYFFLLVVFFIFNGCSVKKIETPLKESKKIQELYDLVTVPQNIEYYTKGHNFTDISYINANKYENSYFSVWNIDKSIATLEDVKWAFNSYRFGKSYGENLQLIDKHFFKTMYDESNFKEYSSINKRAITLQQVNIRAFPTDKPLFLDPTQAGEGFPFDYLQNSTLQANKPIFVSHYSKDREWVHIFSSFTYGWIKTSDMVFLDKKYTDRWQNAQQIFLIKENYPIFTLDHRFLFKSKIGTMLPLIAEDEESYTVLVVSSLKGSKPLFEKVKLSKDISNKGTLVLNNYNFENIVNEILPSKYGWGGIYFQRDCSSMLRDLFAPFGIWLPRNSSKQSRIGEVIDLSELNDYQKIAMIKDRALPFKTLLYKKGHIMLYVGTYNNKIIILHDTWGIKTDENGVEGRIIIGKTIFSTLKLGRGQKNYDKSSELLRNLKSINILNF